MKPLDLTNRKFGKFTALVRVENNKHGKAMWRCLCDWLEVKKIEEGYGVSHGK